MKAIKETRARKTLLNLEKLLKLLSDGQFHSGQAIGEQLGVSRTAVWKLVQRIQQWQVTVYSVRGRGYKIPNGLELLSQPHIENKLKDNQLFKQVILLSSIDSTSNYLALNWQQNPGIGRVCIAEHQTAGRGRKGRQWISPFGANFYFSIGLELPLGLSALGGLSLLVGMSLCNTLNQFTSDAVKIKWPNDLLMGDKKLAGVLVEASGETNDASFLNIGVGVNWNMQVDQGESIDQPWANLKSQLKVPVSRNDILAKILTNLDADLVDFLQHGFGRLAKAWPLVSAFYQQQVVVHLPNNQCYGKEIGIASNGALRVATDSGEQIFHSGEVSLRKLKN